MVFRSGLCPQGFFRVAPVLLVTAFAPAAPLGASPAPAFVARNAAEYWNPPTGHRNVSERLDLDLVVLFYDPKWHLLWAQAPDSSTWFDTYGQPLPMESGDHVRIQGTYVPASGIDGKNVTVTVLGRHAVGAPVSIQGAVGDYNRFDARWVTAEGYVLQQQEVDFTHVQYDLLCEGRLISATVGADNGVAVPQLLNRRVRINFVYVSRRSLAGEVLRIDGWIPQVTDIHVLGRLDDDPRFSLPRTPLDQLDQVPAGQWVRVAGTVRAAEPGTSLTIRDDRGQIVVPTQQPPEWRVGDTIEVIGRLAGHGLAVTLQEPLARLLVMPGAAAKPAVTSQPAMKLRLAEQVMELRPEEAAEHFRTELHGIVTWSDPHAPFFFVQDSSGGIRVQRPPGSEPPPPQGFYVTVEGLSTNGPFAPEILLKNVLIAGNGELPLAPVVPLEEALTGSKEGLRIAMRGYLRLVGNAGPWVELSLTTATGEFTAFVPPSPTLESFVGATVRITGVCAAQSNAQRQLTGISLWAGGIDALQIEEPRPPDPFVAPERPIASLRQFLGVRMADRHVRVSGMVLYDRPGHYLYLQDGDAGLLVLHRDARPLRAGAWIQAVGIPGRDGNRLVLREAVWRPVRPRAAPAPLLVDPSKLMPDTDGRLVTLEGEVEDEFAVDGNVRMLLRGGDTHFEARLDGAAVHELARVGSLVRLTGVYVLEYDEYGHPRTFRIQLRGPMDVQVLRAPSWWTAPRALAIAGASALCALLGVFWVVILRRKVRQQTDQIRAQMEKEAQLNAELERAARLQSLGVLAGGIAHDFNNLLTVIMANLGLAAMDERVQAAAGPLIVDAELGARRAADLTQQLLTFAKGGDPVRRAVALPDVVREAAEFARHGSRVRCDFEFAAGLPAANVDQAQISRVVHNLVLNAAQAMPAGGVVTLRLSPVTIDDGEEPALQPGRYVKLTVSDQGHGIHPEHLPRIFEPYFSTKPKNSGLGLATVHSIVKKHQGHIRVESTPGQGTSFHVWLPVADVPATRDPTRSPFPTAPAKLRVLFMDDEEAIRRSAAGVLAELGHEATVVADGAQAVREYDAAVRAGRRFDAVVLDLTVPGGTGGLAALEMLRRIDPDVRAIVSTGYSNDPVLANYRSYGFSAIAPKPYRVKELARALQEVASGAAG